VKNKQKLHPYENKVAPPLVLQLVLHTNPFFGLIITHYLGGLKIACQSVCLSKTHIFGVEKIKIYILQEKQLLI
jgi:hypothetical protein